MFDSESEIQQLIQAEAAKYGCILMRNNSGALKDKDGRPVVFGLGNTSTKRMKLIKSPDLVGPHSIIITPQMVGQRIAVMAAVECKRPGWRFNPNDAHERAQEAWLNWLRGAGGFAGFAQSIDDVKRILGV